MAVKKENKIIPITLGEFHLHKLKTLCRHTGLSKTGVVQRLIEQYKLFEIDDGNKEVLSPEARESIITD